MTACKRGRAPPSAATASSSDERRATCGDHGHETSPDAAALIRAMLAVTPAVSRSRRCGSRASMARMNGIVEVDAGEDGEHVGLQERDQQFERG